MKCLRCGATNPPENNFCGQCAARLDVPARPHFIGPESYTPQHLAEKILTSRTALEGERKRRTGRRQPAEEHLTFALTMYREMDIRELRSHSG